MANRICSPGSDSKRMNTSVGIIRKKTSLYKMRTTFGDDSSQEIESKLSGQKTGNFKLLSQKIVKFLKADRSLMKTDQLPESAILTLAKGEGELSKKWCARNAERSIR